MRTIFALACTLVLASACTKPQTAEAPKPVETAVVPPYNTEVSMGEVMEHVMNPAGYQFWGGWGVVVDKHGEHDLTPKTDAEWKKVEDGAATIVIATNAIMVPGYARAPQAEWNRYAQDVAKVAMRAKQAAEKHDKDAVGSIGEELDKVCDECHLKFAIPPQP